MKYITDKLIWQPNTYNVCGHVTSYLRGTNLVTQRYYDGYGFQTGDLTSASGVGTYAYNAYDFDKIKWNLLSQTGHLAVGFNCNTGNFTYDSFNRLTHETVSGNSLQSVYTNNGNIIYRSDIGTYTYGDVGTPVVKQIRKIIKSFNISKSELDLPFRNKRQK